ncbi:MAG: hypothetical protein ACREB7_08125 [Sphingopyxis sp.]|uniref:hypothetical protein n=1 Tax=Sphingopyxis sp. TaxID=1908224 RepID=UPI003D6CCC68
MAAIPLTADAIRSVKQTLRQRFPKDKSSHLSEALASALRFKTNIALVKAVRHEDVADPDYRLLEEQPFLERLGQLANRPMTSADRWLNFDNLRYPEPAPIIRTRSAGWRRTDYSKSKRRRAWRNALVAAINEAIRRRLFTIKPGDNRWPGAARDAVGHSAPCVFAFEIADIPAVASVQDGGHDELSIHVALWPTDQAARWVASLNANFLAGDLWATGWLERQDGAWLQVSKALRGNSFSCRNHRLDEAAAIEVAPLGFADRGSFKF